ncbi:hypothetical protein EON65_41940 [archaeon]|nr:MAG: hypothetical protein EON65_41940 [archaeon]
MDQKLGGRPSPQIYVPRGRRELNEKREQEEKLKQEELDRRREEETKRPASDMESGSEPSSPARKALRTNNRWVLDDNGESNPKEATSSSSRYYQPYQPPKIDDSEFSTVIDYEKLASSCIVISGIPVDMSDAGRSRVVEQYQQAGGVLRWMGNVAIVAFTNENIASRALKSNNKSIYKAELLLDSLQNAEYIAGKTPYSFLIPYATSKNFVTLYLHIYNIA